MALAPYTLLVEAFLAGAWVDISADVSGDGVTITTGRSTAFDDIQPSTLDLTLFNAAGKWTPGNPLSPYWPDVAEGAPIRVTIIKSSTSYRRFTGYVDDWTPTWPTGGAGGAVCRVRASDVLARLNQRKLMSDFAEQIIYRGFAGTPTFADVWPLDDQGVAGETPRNANGGAPARLVHSIPPAGSLTIGNTSDYLLVDGIAQFEEAPTSVGGNVLTFTPQGSPGGFSFFVRVTTDVVPPILYTVIGGLWDSTGKTLGEIRLVDNAGQNDINLYDANGTFMFTIVYGVRPTFWYEISAVRSGNSSRWYTGGVLKGTAAVAIHNTATLTLGARMFPNAPGKITGSTAMELSTVGIYGGAYSSPWSYAVPGAVVASQGRMADLVVYATTSGITSTYAVTGTDRTRVGRTPTAGTTIGERLAELARTIGGVIHVRPDGVLRLIHPDACRPPTPALTIGLGADDAGDQTISVSVTDRPTRVRASAPTGDVTVVDGAAEATGRYREESITTTAADAAGARDAASFRLAENAGVRVSKVTLDLLTGASNLWAQAYAVDPTDRVRVSGQSAAQVGVTDLDGHVQGTTEVYTTFSAAISYDLSPPVDEGLFDDAEWGRFAAGDGVLTVTGGTALIGGGGAATYGSALYGAGVYGAAGSGGSTGTGTLVIASNDPATRLSNDPASYPLDLDWVGERVTVTTAPVATSSPWTVTVTARGVAPTVARTHDVGEPIDVWHAAVAAI